MHFLKPFGPLKGLITGYVPIFYLLKLFDDHQEHPIAKYFYIKILIGCSDTSAKFQNV